MTDISVSLLAKRKRGRPRKDGNLSRVGTFPENRALMKTQHIEVMPPTPDEIKKTQEVNKNAGDGTTVDGMMGSMIYGVIEGSFDAGYLISVRIGNNETPYRGVIFHPFKFIPVSAANDVAPQVKMCKRREIPVPAYDDLNRISRFSPQPENIISQSLPASKQPVLRPVLPSMPLQATPYSLDTFMVPHEAIILRTSSSSNVGKVGVDDQTGSLRMVEQDDVMQAFEVSTTSKGSQNNTATTNLAGKENTNQKPPQVHGKAVESGVGLSTLAHRDSNVEIHYNFMENMPQSAYQIQHNEMICRQMEHQREFARDGLQNSTIELQSVPREPLYFNEMRSPNVNFHEDIFTNQDSQERRLGSKFHPDEFVDSISKSPNLKLDLSSTIHQKKPQASDSCLETNYLGYHQALVTGNPLLLPPDLIGDHMEFMLEKSKTPPNQKTPHETSNSELETGPGVHAEAAGSPSAPYKLELATPDRRLAKQTASSAGGITDMDFVLSDVVQTADSHGPRSDISETKHRWSE